MGVHDTDNGHYNDLPLVIEETLFQIGDKILCYGHEEFGITELEYAPFILLHKGHSHRSFQDIQIP